MLNRNESLMAPVTVKEILACRERLGMVQSKKAHGDLRPLRHVILYSGGEASEGLSQPLNQTIMIFPPALPDDGVDAGCRGSLLASLSRNISCAAFSETQRIPRDFMKLSEKTETPVFASCYNATLLKSRLTGLLRERGERTIMVHGVLVEVSGYGVLLTGESGIGKTSCGLEIMALGHRWVADDAVVLEGRGSALFGRGHERTRNMIVTRCFGLRRADALLGEKTVLEETRVDMVIRLVRDSGKCGVSRGDGFRSVYEVVGVPLPCYHLTACHDPGQMAKKVMGVIGGLSPS